MRSLSGFLCAAALLAATPTAASPLAAAPPTLAPSDSTLSAFWLRHLRALDARLDAAEADTAQAAERVTQTLRTARALAQEPEVAGSRAFQTLLVRAHALYETVHGPVAPTAMAAADVHALRADALAEAVETAGRPVLPEVPASLPPTVPVVSRALATRSTATHLAYPIEAETFVAAQLPTAQRLRGLRNRRVLRTIERTLRRRGLPPELKYVAMIESALDPAATSHAGAEGLWQFMPATAAQYGLDSTSVRDVARSTEAAARYLRQLHRAFRGDWQLALAAYNAGPGRVRVRVQRHLAATGQYPTFWDIRADLPRETQAYVPRFIAVARLLG